MKRIFGPLEANTLQATGNSCSVDVAAIGFDEADANKSIRQDEETRNDFEARFLMHGRLQLRRILCRTGRYSRIGRFGAGCRGCFYVAVLVVGASGRKEGSFLVKNRASGVGSTFNTMDCLDVCLRGVGAAGIKEVPDAAALYTGCQIAAQVDRAAAEGLQC